MPNALSTATRYDPQTGLVAARQLVDGRRLRFEYGSAESGAGVRRLSLQSAWVVAVQDWIAEHVSPGWSETFGNWLPSQTVVTDLAVDPFDGLKGYTAGNGLTTRRTFDKAGRLTELAIEPIGRLTYRYDRGPRLRGVDTPDGKTDFHYVGFGRLDRDQDKAPDAAPALINVAFRPQDRDALGRTVADRQFRYTYTPQGQVATVSDHESRMLARYRYNSLGQRVTKSVVDAGSGRERTTFTLWQDGNRVAELDGDGSVLAQYLYLAEGWHARPVAKLENGRLLAIHTDHRGAPLAMTDEDRRIVWRADIGPWGAAVPAGTASAVSAAATTPPTFGPASLNLRLPGQYYDAETGLHDNWRRTYDPATGRYLQPDPLGYPDGPDPYSYVNGDPINRIDPTGLYAIDVHYYMTYFLALTAGVDQETAWIVATADQTIDNVNPYTDAFPSITAGWNDDARSLYHFTQTSTTWDTLNNQTTILLGYATKADNPCLKAQLYDEFMHAYQDTFGHRDRENVPYGTGGHATDGVQPDLTYNDPYDYDGSSLPLGWYVREQC